MKTEYDFSKGKRGSVVSAVNNKTRITIRLDDEILEWFRNEVDQMGGGNYQTLMNDALVAFIQQRSVIDAVRQVVREELAAPRANLRRS